MAHEEDPEALVRLTVARDEGEASVIVGLLRTEGINALMQVSDLSAGRGDGLLTFSGWREILVRRADLDHARSLIEPTAQE